MVDRINSQFWSAPKWERGVGYGLGDAGYGGYGGGLGYGGYGGGVGYGYGYPRFAQAKNKFHNGVHANNAFGVNKFNNGAFAANNQHHNDVAYKNAVQFSRSKGAKSNLAKSHANKFNKHNKNAFDKNIKKVSAAKRVNGGVGVWKE